MYVCAICGHVFNPFHDLGDTTAYAVQWLVEDAREHRRQTQHNLVTYDDTLKAEAAHGQTEY